MPVDLLRKCRAILVRIHGMEAAPIKGKTKRHSFDVALEEVQDHEATLSIGICSLFTGPLNRKVGCINSDDLEALLRQPNCVVAGSAADFQCPTGSDWCCRYGLNEVEIGLANIPRG